MSPTEILHLSWLVVVVVAGLSIAVCTWFAARARRRAYEDYIRRKR